MLNLLLITTVPVPIHWKEYVKAGLVRTSDLTYFNMLQLGNLSHGAIEWLFVPRKMENHIVLLIFNPIMYTQHLKHTIRLHLFTRLDQYLMERGKSFLTPGTATIVCQYRYCYRYRTAP